MTTQENKVSAIQEILLNKISNLKWYYFEIELSFSETDKKILVDESFFEGIDLKSRTFINSIDESIYKKAITNILAVANGNQQVFMDVAKRIFDINVILNESESDKGLMGQFNEKDRNRRNEKYKDLIRKGFRGTPEHIVVMAEGDSWFEFPRVYLKIDAVKDILDWLIEADNYAVYSLASGGDWLSNMLYLGEYIEDLPKVSPDVFLISGGGNDLVGNNRLATMVINPIVEGRRNINETQHLKMLLALRRNEPNIDLEKYEFGLSLIADEFLQFLNLVFVQYFVFLNNLCNDPRYKKMVIITHGYDFVIPSNKKHGNWLSIQRILNEFTDTGKWLYEALEMKGVTDAKDQEAALYTMIYEFNEVMIKLANYFPNVFHIDCRGVAESNDWFDELHLKSEKFEQVTETFKICIQDNVAAIRQPNGEFSKTKKVYRVLDHI